MALYPGIDIWGLNHAVRAAVFQVVMIVMLILFRNFNLVSIAIVRGCTEAVLFALRFGLYRKYRHEFA